MAFIPKFVLRKLLYSGIIALLAFLLVLFVSTSSLASGLENSGRGLMWAFLILFVGFYLMQFPINNSKYLNYYLFNAIKILFYSLPIVALFSSLLLSSFAVKSVGGDEIAAVGAGIGAGIGSFIVIFICLIIGLIGGLIIGSFNKEPKIDDTNLKTGWSQGFLLALIIIGIMLV